MRIVKPRKKDRAVAEINAMGANGFFDSDGDDDEDQPRQFTVEEATQLLQASIPAGMYDWSALSADAQKAKIREFNDSRRYGVRIGKSKYGYGLFTTRDFTRDEVIAKYDGVVIPSEAGDKLPEEQYNKLAPGAEPGTTLVGEIMSEELLNFTTFVNDPGYIEQLGGLQKGESNCKLKSTDDEVFMVTTKTIGPGVELMFDYGPQYWEGNAAYHHNNKKLMQDTANAAKSQRRREETLARNHRKAIRRARQRKAERESRQPEHKARKAEGKRQYETQNPRR